MAKQPSSTERSLLGYGLIALNAVVVAVALYAWGSLYDWQVSSIYSFFPLLGLLAFGLMWTHYVAAAVNRYYDGVFDLKKYYEWTGWAVIILVVLHPVLLWYALFRDGLGLPPQSYLAYVGKSMKAAALLGTAALIIFIAYEFKPWIKKTRFWPVMIGLNDLAMFFIFIHARRLGGSLQLDWFSKVWIFYGIVLIICISQRVYYIYKKRPI